MRLLVSVRNAVEAARAVAGGADIVDAKDPARGSIAPVAAEDLDAIRAAVPPALPLSAALGDVTTRDDVARAIDGLTSVVAFIKLGFLGVPEPRVVEALLAEAVKRAAALTGRPAVIGVAYADHARCRSLHPTALCGVLRTAGAGGLLVDTCRKEVGNLFQLIAPMELARLGSLLEADELLFALGGSLSGDQARAAREVGAGVFGVRGAVCIGGRTGVVDEALVRGLARAVHEGEASSRVQGPGSDDRLRATHR